MFVCSRLCFRTKYCCRMRMLCVYYAYAMRMLCVCRTHNMHNRQKSPCERLSRLCSGRKFVLSKHAPQELINSRILKTRRVAERQPGEITSQRNALHRKKDKGHASANARQRSSNALPTLFQRSSNARQCSSPATRHAPTDA